MPQCSRGNEIQPFEIEKLLHRNIKELPLNECYARFCQSVSIHLRGMRTVSDDIPMGRVLMSTGTVTEYFVAQIAVVVAETNFKERS